MSRRARLRLAVAALLALVAGVVLATGRLTGTFALFTAGACWMLGLLIAILSGHPLY